MSVNTSLEHPPFQPKSSESLPDEILSAVFLDLVQEEFYEEPEFYETGSALYPWTLSAVCRGWRRVCLGTAPLWAYFKLGGSMGRREEFEDAAVPRRLGTHLQLSRTRNAAVYVHGNCLCMAEYIRLGILAAHAASRWKVLKISFEIIDIPGFPQPPPADVLPLVTPADQVLSSLTQIAYDGINGYTGGRDLLILTRETLPSIRHATFSYMNAHPPNMIYSFPWERLKTLSLHCYGGQSDDLTTILSQCTSLEKLHLSFDGDVIVQLADSHRDAPSLPQLTYFNLGVNDNTALTLIPHMKAPNLRVFRYGVLRSQTITAFTNFILPSAKSLIELDIHLPIFNPADYLRIFGVLQNLEFLVLGPPELPTTPDAMISCDELLVAFTRGADASSSKPDLLPRLRWLILMNFDLDPSVLTRMVESRLHCDDSAAEISSLAVLETLDVDYDDVKTPPARRILAAVEDSLQKYVDEGKLELRIWPAESESDSSDSDEA